jgi:hypothetical protein
MRNALVPAGIVLCIVASFSGGVAVPAKDNSEAPRDHASIRAYANAVLSATDTTSGITISVDTNGTTLTAHDAAGGVIWRVDALAALGQPATGFPVVRSVAIVKPGVASIVIGKQLVGAVDLRTGEVTLQGEN